MAGSTQRAEEVGNLRGRVHRPRNVTQGEEALGCCPRGGMGRAGEATWSISGPATPPRGGRKPPQRVILQERFPPGGGGRGPREAACSWAGPSWWQNTGKLPKIQLGWSSSAGNSEVELYDPPDYRFLAILDHPFNFFGALHQTLFQPWVFQGAAQRLENIFRTHPMKFSPDISPTQTPQMPGKNAE